MNWLFPTFLGGLFALALPIALHFLRRQPKRIIVFPSLRFLAAAHQHADKRHRLMRILVLILRCLALALLAAAFARPFFASTDFRAGKGVVVVVDNSFSLQANDRWPTLRSWALDQIGPMAAGDKLGILVTGPWPSWLVPLTTDTSAAINRLGDLTPGWQSARVEPALRRAADTLSATSGVERRIVVLGDHQRASWVGADFTNPFPRGITATFPTISPGIAKQAALGIPTLSRREDRIQVKLSVRIFTGAGTRTLRVFRDEALIPVHEESFDVSAQKIVPLQFEIPLGSRGEARFRFELDPDDLPADDAVYAVWQAALENAVFMDTPTSDRGADFLAAALAATASLKPNLNPQKLPPGQWPKGSVVILRNETSFGAAAAARLEEFLRDGGSALIFVTGGQAQKAWLDHVGRISIRPVKATQDPLVIHDWSMEHPVVASLAEHEVRPLLGWTFREGWALPTDALEPLGLWSEGAAAIGEGRVGKGRVLLCGFPPDRGEGDWPVHPAFVPFVHRAVSYLYGESLTTAPAFKVGDAINLPSVSGEWTCLDGSTKNEPRQAVTTPIRPTAPGIYAFSAGGTRTMFAVNFDPEESDLTPWEDGTPWDRLVASKSESAATNESRIQLAASEAEQRSPLWWWLIATVALLCLAELGLANRTAR